MSDPYLYYVIAPVEGLHSTLDFRLHSAELYGSPPNYTPSPDDCPAYRHPYETLGKIPFTKYPSLIPECFMDEATQLAISNLSDRCLQDFTCIGLEVDLDRPDYTTRNAPETDNGLFQYI